MAPKEQKVYTAYSALRVLITRDGDFFFAQGLEIDYGTQGKDLEDVKKNFEQGLSDTIGMHLEMYGDVDKFAKPAPIDIWARFLTAKPENKWVHGQAQKYKITTDNLRNLPFEGLQFLEPAAACA